VRLLLDTHVVLWQLAGIPRLGPIARHEIEASDLVVSVVSFAEIGIKAAVGKLRAPTDIEQRLRELDVAVLSLSPQHGLGVGALPLHHRDPFDRLLISQARVERLTLVSADPAFGAYDLRVLPASE
jgi:PIN domain nuclease of toxin-antitoxin system